MYYPKAPPSSTAVRYPTYPYGLAKTALILRPSAGSICWTNPTLSKAVHLFFLDAVQFHAAVQPVVLPTSQGVDKAVG